MQQSCQYAIGALTPSAPPVPPSKNARSCLKQHQERTPLTPRTQARLQEDLNKSNISTNVKSSPTIPNARKGKIKKGGNETSLVTIKGITSKHKLNRKNRSASTPPTDCHTNLATMKGITSEHKVTKKHRSASIPPTTYHTNHNKHYHHTIEKPSKVKRNMFRRLGSGKDLTTVSDTAITFGKRRKGKWNDSTTCPSLNEDNQSDPLTRLIEAHNTQKVRFNFSRNVVSDQSIICRSASDPSSTNESDNKTIPPQPTSSHQGTTRPSNLMKVMKRALQKKGSEDTEDENLDSQPISSKPSVTKSSNIMKLMRRTILKKNSEDTVEECIFSKNLTTTLQNSSPFPTDNFELKESSFPLRPQSYNKSKSNKLLSPKHDFREDESTTEVIKSHIQKGERAQFETFHYPTAGQQYLIAMQALDANSYPDNHPLRLKTLKLLNDVHHSQRSLEHSCQIVKMGLRHEEKTEYIKALKMYTIAYRIRRDALGKMHPSLPVLLNMLGSLQVKRGELEEAMQIFKLVLNGRLDDGSGNVKVLGGESLAPWTKSVTLMEMGIIYQKWDDMTMSLQMYHESLGCIIKEESHCGVIDNTVVEKVINTERSSKKTIVGEKKVLSRHLGSQEIRIMRTTSLPAIGTCESEEMEAYLEGGETDSNARDYLDVKADPCAFYDSIFHDGRSIEGKSVNVNVAMTLYYIGNLRRKSKNLEVALSAYQAAYRGMSLILGAKHTNVAAILGNIGNCHKELKSYDKAYNIYQKVLKIESLHFGLGHPEVIVTMHNIAMIEKCRGNYKEAISLYREVLTLQRSRLGLTHESVAVTSSCLADVYEISGDFESAIATYKETISLRCQALNDRFHPDLAVLYHSCAMVFAKKHDLENAASYLRKAVRLYEYNKISNDSYLNAQRDAADIHAKLALLPGKMQPSTRKRSF